jgi:RNA recognition motif-containing protein
MWASNLIHMSRESGNPKGFGYVTFSSVQDAEKAYEQMMGAEIAGRPVRLDFATPRPDRSEGGFSRGGGRGGGRGFGADRGRGGRGGKPYSSIFEESHGLCQCFLNLSNIQY